MPSDAIEGLTAAIPMVLFVFQIGAFGLAIMGTGILIGECVDCIANSTEKHVVKEIPDCIYKWFIAFWTIWYILVSLDKFVG